MNEAEKLLRLCADTMKMPGWRDALSLLTEEQSRVALSDELLADVAGGIVPLKRNEESDDK